jgi:hypothetical protein
MKKEDLQNSQQGTGSAENRGISREEQKNSATHISNNQQNDISRQTGLGRDLMADIEDLGGMSRRDDYAGGDEDLTNENLNAANDQ